MTTPISLSDEQLSLWICEKLEPRENWTIYEGAFSPKGMWRVHAITDPYRAWQHRDIVNDPAMLKMLLEHPGFISVDYFENDEESPKTYHVSFCGSAVHTVDCGELIKDAENVKLGRANAESFALALGYPQPTQETGVSTK